MNEVRYDTIGRLTILAAGHGYVMVRRPRAFPFILTQAQWDALPTRESMRGRPDAG